MMNDLVRNSQKYFIEVPQIKRSNSLRRLHAGVFCNWKRLEYLTLENIVVDDVNACFQCNRTSNENPVVSNTKLREISSDSIKTCYFPRLKELEISCSGFSKHCLGFLIRNTRILSSLKVLEVSDLSTSELEIWCGMLCQLETLILFRAPELNRESVDLVIEGLPTYIPLAISNPLTLRRQI
ncbi:unnamed protein product [Lepeophtheirus salmonis]|uniref:(salmon louse) hypothetical protein n=1 Tax=Lepeophtheirus salmonis TaxID=72036 RepID=A0A7R8H0B1_LEPSM|nr:unnamed protein product [Lepeophtheirus salmonis]CAF2782570.1 unnamed protein product [Lepeophtheirus salmonis]